MLVSCGVKSWRQERGEERMVRVPWEEIMAVALLLIRREKTGEITTDNNNNKTVYDDTMWEKQQFTMQGQMKDTAIRRERKLGKEGTSQ